MNEAKPSCGWNESKPYYQSGFDNHSEPLERIRAALGRAERAESNAADLAADLQGARIALREALDALKTIDTTKAINGIESHLRARGLLAQP